jgi:DNA polymerase I-like protein with 3'-5' exonuclease and polymerase domains
LHTSWVDQILFDDIQKTKVLIELVKPNVIIALGNLALLALTGFTSIKKWRGSQLTYTSPTWTCQVIPTYHPRYIQRDYSVRATTTQDFRRALRVSDKALPTKPQWKFKVRPSFQEAVMSLHKLLQQISATPTKISVDIETRAGHLACIGFATDKHKAFCIPLMCVERPEGYWSATEELLLINQIRDCLTHANAQCFGQNFIYDIQYIYRFWFFTPNTWYDTMLTQHLLFPGQPKGLDYLASLYCEHYVYWKDDGKLWDASLGEDQLWAYNCEDCVRTYEVMEQQQPLIAQLGLTAQWDFQQNKLYPMLLKAMFRGVRAAIKDKTALSFELMGEITEREQWLQQCFGHPLNIKSPTQMQAFFTEDLKIKPVISRKTGRPTLDDKALETISQREPLLKTPISKIQELRSLGVFKSTFVDARLDKDGRLRSSYNPAGTDTFRLSSSENAFGSGLNFQNIPLGSGDINGPDALILPNVRKLFLPDEGYTIFDMDLQSADFYTVVWEADDQEFKDLLASGEDMHGVNAKNLFSLSCSANEVKKMHGGKRQLAKIWCHATNYGAGPTTMSRACGITIHEAEKLRSRWFQMHPGIARWHKRTEEELHAHRRVSNKFGYRFVFFDRVDAALPVALGWTPQSTTGCVINRAWAAIEQTIPEAEMLIQVHDSLVGQVPTRLYTPELELQILQASRIIVPYNKPMIIPAGIKSSTISWGACS